MGVQITFGDTLGGRYLVKGRLGRGGMAEVYRAFDSNLDLEVALKLLPRQLAAEHNFVARFRREARMLARLTHPNILRLYDIGEDPSADLYFLVLEYLHNGTLKDRLGGSPWRTSDVVDLLSPVAAAIDYAHHHDPPIVHRDLKPANIMFGEHDRVVVTDFGLARMLRPEHAAHEGLPSELSIHTLTLGYIMGTPAYMAPEQAQGRVSGAAADRYSLGVIAYELLTGRLPFHADTPQATLIQVATQTVPSPGELNRALQGSAERALLRMLAKAPEDRFQSAAEFVKALGQVRQTTTVVHPKRRQQTPPSDSNRAARPRQPAVLAAAAGLLIAVLAAGALFLLPGQPSPSSREVAPALAAVTVLPSPATPTQLVAVTVVATATVPTPTIAPTSTPSTNVAWQALLTRLDPLWGTDWDGAIAQLMAFVEEHQSYGPAREKLYAALVLAGQDLIANGRGDEAVDRLQRARALSPERTEAGDTLLSLTPTATPVPTPTLAPPAPRPTPLPPAPVRVPAPTSVAPTAVPPTPTKLPFTPPRSGGG